MKKYFISAMVLSLVLCSCNKDAADVIQSLEGKWNWKSSLYNDGTKMLPSDSSVIENNFVTFTNENYMNHAQCVIGGNSAGIYKIYKVDNKRILIFKSPTTRSDTFYIDVTNIQLDITEVTSNYSIKHTFFKCDKLN